MKITTNKERGNKNMEQPKRITSLQEAGTDNKYTFGRYDSDIKNLYIGQNAVFDMYDRSVYYLQHEIDKAEEDKSSRKDVLQFSKENIKDLKNGDILILNVRGVSKHDILEFYQYMDPLGFILVDTVAKARLVKIRDGAVISTSKP